MTIDQYLELTGRTAEDLASSAGITPTSLSRIRRNNQNTTRDVMRSIIAASDGLISADALVKSGTHAAAPATSRTLLSGGNGGDVAAPDLERPQVAA